MSTTQKTENQNPPLKYLTHTNAFMNLILFKLIVSHACIIPHLGTEVSN